VLVHHPYESFEQSVEQFISDAAADPQTVAVKMTAYRVGDDTPFVKSLVKAAESGKQVACVIEIKVRFDEERNLHWAAQLERAGAHVTFGVPGLKTHAKLALVVRKEADGLRSYAHIGTGNYHVRTARIYADFGLFTCDPAITRDVVNLFHYLTGRSAAPLCSKLLVAPARCERGCWS
jgi:polyphosphate kinase